MHPFCRLFVLVCVGLFAVAACGDSEPDDPLRVVDEDDDDQVDDPTVEAVPPDPNLEVRPVQLAAHDRELRVVGVDDERSDYSFEITGEFDVDDDMPADAVDGTTASGSVAGEGDEVSYDFSGDLVSLEVDGSAELYVDDVQLKGGDPDETHELVVEGMDYDRSDFELTTTEGADLRDDGDLEEGEDVIDGGSATGFVQAANARDTFLFEGGLTRLSVDGSARVYFDDEVIVGTPRSHAYGAFEDAETIEVALSSSKKLLRANGRVSEKMVARYAARAFALAGFNYEVTYNLRAQDPPDEKSHCSGESTAWWRDQLDEGEVEFAAKDSNPLLMPADGGGCGAIAGWYATTPASNIDEEREWAKTGSDRWNANIHANLHEIGHNLGARHDHEPDEEGMQHWGTGWNEWHEDEDKGYWHRTPNVAGNGAPNYCDADIEKREYDDMMRHQYYNDCAIDRFVIQ
ncbi:MAG: hypothetical protein ACOCV2_08075 [Persicimonas sp.]